MPARKTILIIENSQTDRQRLAQILLEDYAVLEAADGAEGLALLEAHTDVAAIVLDLLLPVMDGYAFLKAVQTDSRYAHIPVIVSTGSTNKACERRTLRLGAWDFVPKPYDAEVLRLRLKHAIECSEVSLLHQLRYLAEYDTLTGIYNKARFFEATRVMLSQNPTESFLFVRVDLNRFQLVNAFYSTEEGDNVLKYIAEQLQIFAQSRERCTYGRIEADTFCLCLPCNGQEIHTALERARESLTAYNPNYNIDPRFGLYRVEDNRMPVNLMYDRATLAAKTCKDDYRLFYAMYDEEMSSSLVMEQELINKMTTALQTGQFVIYLQPQYNLRTNQPAGAEALVRWNYPGKELMLPKDFIPVFERNGFISQLDFYVWEQVCRLLRGWLDAGKTPLPISVNISRVNVYNPKLADILCGLTEKYQVPPSLLNLELTESAYTDNPEAMTETMARLQKKGFTILMDDFGSGYSSLNILKDIAVDVLKIDMQFLTKAKIVGRGENILASVVRMAKWLTIPVVIEGVETEGQIQFLRSIGCEYVQGFYFCHPLPPEEYEQLLGTVGDVQEKKSVASFDKDRLWADDPQSEMQFREASQAAVIYAFHNDRIELLRVNNAFYQLMGCKDASVSCTDPLLLVEEKHRESLLQAFRTTAKTHKHTELDYCRCLSDNKRIWVHIYLQYIHNIGEQSLLLGTLSDVTVQHETAEKLEQYHQNVRRHLSDDPKEMQPTDTL